jgi:hypothetical protein
MLKFVLRALVATTVAANALQATQIGSTAPLPRTHFTEDTATLRRRAPALGKDDALQDQLAAAIKKPVPAAKKGDVILIALRFNGLWKGDIVEAATAQRVVDRLAQLTPQTVAAWKTRSGLADPIAAALQLTAENAAFPSGKFSEAAFRGLLQPRK